MNEEEAEKEAMAIVDRAAWDAALLVDRAESGDRGALFDVANLFLNQRHLEIMVAKLKDELTPLQADENGGIAYLVEAILLWLGRAEACLRNQCFVRQRGSDECAPPVLAALPEIGEPLLPCPFCGGPAEFAYTPWDEESKTGDDGSGSDADLSDNRAFGTLRSLVADQFAAQVGDNNGDVVLLSLTAIGEKERRLDS